MLDLNRVDLGELGTALEDHTLEHEWWVDPASGEIHFRSAALVEDGEDWDPDDLDLRRVEPISSDESYGDLEDFVGLVSDPRARELLARAIAGRGAFRRFKDTLFEFPELREAWFRFRDARMERRAIEWLARDGLIARAEADGALSLRADVVPPAAPGVVDGRAVASAVGADLRAEYGDRLVSVVLFGSWARGDAQPESDIDLLVVLDEVSSRQIELDRMNELLWRHSLANDTVVTELPVSEREFLESGEPLIVRARGEGVTVG